MSYEADYSSEVDPGPGDGDQSEGPDIQPDSSWINEPEMADVSADIQTSAGPFAAITSTGKMLNNVAGIDATVSWMNVTEVNVTHANAIGRTDVTIPIAHRGEGDRIHNLVPSMAMMIVPESIILFLLVVFIVAYVVVRFKWKRDKIAKDHTMNTDDLTFYHQVCKLPGKDSTDACSTLLPNEMPPFGYFDADKPDKYRSLVPALKTDLNIIPGYIEVLRVQLRPRRSTLPENLRAVRSSPDAVYGGTGSDCDDLFGRQLHITTSSPAILVGLWNRYRSEIFRHQNDTAELCPIHAEIQSLMSGNTTASDDRDSVPAYRGESEGFEFHLASSTSSIPRKITCRFCRERAMRGKTPLTSTPGTSPKAHRKRSLSHCSVLEDGLAAMADECGTLSTRALHSLGPVKIEHLKNIHIQPVDTSTHSQTHPDPSSNHQGESSAAVLQLEEIDSGARRQSYKPEVQLEVFRDILTKRSSEGSKSGGMSSVSSGFFKSGKDVALSSTSCNMTAGSRKSSRQSLNGRLSDQRSRSRRSIGHSKSDHLARRIGSSIGRISNGRLDQSSSDGRFAADKQKMSNSEVESLIRENQTRPDSSSILLQHTGSSICKSVASSINSPSREHVASKRSSSIASGSQGTGGKSRWSCIQNNSAMSFTSAKSTSSAKSRKSKSSSSRKINWCFRKSKSSSSSEGPRSPPELVKIPSPPEIPIDGEDAARSMLPAGEEVDGYLLLPSYYGTDSDSASDSEDELTWLNGNQY